MKKITFFVILTAVLLLSISESYAKKDSVDMRKTERSGFKEVAAAFRGMTPEQRAAIMAQAEKMAKEMEGLSPREKIRLESDLRMKKYAVKGKIDKVDPKSLDTKKEMNLDEAMQSIGMNSLNDKEIPDSNVSSGNSYSIQFRIPKKEE